MNLNLKSLLITVPVQGNLARKHHERFEHLPDDIQVSKASDDAGSITKVSAQQCFVTIHDIGSRREYMSLRDGERSKRKGWIRGNTKIGPVLEVNVTNYWETLWD